MSVLFMVRIVVKFLRLCAKRPISVRHECADSLNQLRQVVPRESGGRYGRQNRHDTLATVEPLGAFFQEVVVAGDDRLDRALRVYRQVEGAFLERQQFGAPVPGALREHEDTGASRRDRGARCVYLCPRAVHVTPVYEHGACKMTDDLI